MSFLPRSFRTLVAALMATFFSVSPLAALGECEVVVDLGTVRGCTFTEELGQCLTWALESYEECVEGADNWLDRFVCESAVQVDLLACNLEAAGDILRMISPFAE